MLQQTGVKTVGPYFEKFLARWPDVAALGRASQDDVLRMWAGLGYYSRARNLHACAVAVLRDHGGVFPETEEGLRQLPGIGPYTAAAIGAIAFDIRTMPVDGNIERVVSRLYAVEEPLPQAKPRIQELASTLLGPSRAGDSAQALMDLGSSFSGHNAQAGFFGVQIEEPRSIKACALSPARDGPSNVAANCWISGFACGSGSSTVNSRDTTRSILPSTGMVLMSKAIAEIAAAV